MKISEDLAYNSDQYTVKGKIGTGMMKYYFDQYQVIKTKGGGTTSKYKSSVFSPLEHMKSERKTSFKFVSQAGDTAIVNIIYNANYKGLDNQHSILKSFHQNSILLGHYTEVLESSNNLTVIISTNKDSVEWELILIETFGSNMPDGGGFQGWLTNGQQIHYVNPIVDFASQGKKSMMDLMLDTRKWLKGYEFKEYDTTTGAVQVAPGSKNWVVWFPKNIDPQLRFIMAATYTALLAESQHMDADL